jgi:hypothetical protein
MEHARNLPVCAASSAYYLARRIGFVVRLSSAPFEDTEHRLARAGGRPNLFIGSFCLSPEDPKLAA